MNSKTAHIKLGSCRGCGCCVRACPNGYIHLKKHHAEIVGNCGGCGACVKACPFDAIEY